MRVGVLGAGPVGRSFLDLLPRYGHDVSVYDVDGGLTKGLPPGVSVRDSEEAVGADAEFLLCCADMFSGDGYTRAVKALRPGSAASDDFSAKAPAYGAFRAAARDDVAYWSIHTMFAPPKTPEGFRGQLTIEIPVQGCWGRHGDENAYIADFRNTLKEAGTGFKRLWTPEDHDRRMVVIQATTSAENICTALALARLGINPLKGGGVYSDEMDKIKFLMALRAIGEEGSSNARVYGSIAMMNPFAPGSIAAYSGILKKLVRWGRDDPDTIKHQLQQDIRTIGRGRIDEATALWNRTFGPVENNGNSYSSHLAEASFWASMGYPLDILTDLPSPPYRMRELMALAVLGTYDACVDNLGAGANDDDFLKAVGDFVEWSGEASGSRTRARVEAFEDAFFRPVREAFPDDIRGIAAKTNALIKRVSDLNSKPNL